MKVGVHDLEIGYRQAGRGPPLVLVHGAMCHAAFWRPQLEGLSDEYTVVAWDEPGAGESSDVPAHFALADYAACLAGLIETLGLAPAHVCGLSWGGTVALALFRDHPGCVRTLVLADSYAGWRGSLSAKECELRLESGRRVAAAHAEELESLWPGLTAVGVAPEVTAELHEVVSGFRPASIELTAELMAACDLRAVLPTVDVPTLLIWGEQDERSPRAVAEQIHAGIPGSRLVFIPGAGHVSSLEAPDRFNAELREFCR